MSTVVDAPRSRSSERAVRSRAEATGRRPVLGGVVWIGVIALLAAGVVAMNVLLLQLNVGYDDLGRERAQLKADIAHLESQLSSAAANARIARQAQEHLGLVEADPETTTYVTIAP